MVEASRKERPELERLPVADDQGRGEPQRSPFGLELATPERLPELPLDEFAATLQSFPLHGQIDPRELIGDAFDDREHEMAVLGEECRPIERAPEALGLHRTTDHRSRPFMSLLDGGDP